MRILVSSCKKIVEDNADILSSPVFDKKVYEV
jgi:hypothetical protein